MRGIKSGIPGVACTFYDSSYLPIAIACKQKVKETSPYASSEKKSRCDYATLGQPRRNECSYAFKGSVD